MARDDDLRLVSAVLTGDLQAAASLHARVLKAARSVAARLDLRRARPPFDAEDLAQTVHQQLFAANAQALRRYAGDAALSTWLYTIAYRHALRALRTRPEPPEDPQTEAPSPHKITTRRETIAQVRGVLQTLPSEDRLLLQMLFERELSAPAAGRLLGLSPDGARMRKMRLLRRLSSKLAGLWP